MLLELPNSTFAIVGWTITASLPFTWFDVFNFGL